MFVLWISFTAIVGVTVGSLFSGKISKAVKSLETTVETRLTNIQTAIREPFIHSQFMAGTALKSEEEYVEEIATKVLAKLKAAERAAKI
jgi:hypothetical protein